MAPPVDFLRNFLGAHRCFAALLVALALAMKVLVPAGYMLAPQMTAFTVTICADAQGKRITHEIAVPKKVGHGEGTSDRGKSDTVCSWSLLAMASLGGTPPVLLALALALILALGFLPAALPVARTASRLRPPLRGPPTLAR